jgi:monoamine oxidase
MVARLVHLLLDGPVHVRVRPRGQAAGPLKFAGEHADSFYSWQGFMEGACLSGIRAANEVLADVKSRVI